jgi:hypothetical protein
MTAAFHHYGYSPYPLALLRSRRERPCSRRAAEQRDERAAVHCIPEQPPTSWYA